MPSRRPSGVLAVLAVLCGSPLLLAQSRAAPEPPAAVVKPPGPKAEAKPVVQPPEGPLEFTRNIAGDSKPLLLNADEFATWTENGRRIILMKGQVLIQQSVVRMRCAEAAVVVDLGALKRTSIVHAEIYAEGDVRLEDGRADRKGGKAVVNLYTRGELKIVSQQKKVLQQAVPDAPLYGRAMVQLFGTPQQGAPTIVPVKNEGRVTPTPPPAPKSTPPPAPKPTPPPAPQPTPMPTPRPIEPPPAFDPVPPGSGAPPPASVRGSGRDLPEGSFTAAKAVPTQRPGPTGPGVAPGPRLLQPAPGLEGPTRQYSVAPRTGQAFQLKSETLPGGEQASIFTGGVIISVKAADGVDLIDIEADNALIWSRGGLTEQMIENLRGPQGQTSRELEFYFSGNVQIRQQSQGASRLLKADEIYLDASRNVAIAVAADLELFRPGMLQPIHIRADELRQLSDHKFETLRAEIFSSKLPSDPGLKVVLSRAVVDEVRVPKTTLFGGQILDRNGNPAFEVQRPVDGKNARIEFEGVPFFFLPSFQGDASDPLGPLETVRIGGNRVYGFEIGASFDVYDLFHLQPIPDSRWRLDLDYLSRRGPALGTHFDHAGQSFFGLPARVNGLVKAYGLYDEGTDILGGGRGESEGHPDYRGRLFVRENVQGLPNGFVVQGQIGLLSDRNYLEQFFKTEFDTDLDQETSLYIKQTDGSLAWTGLASAHVRNWVTETEWFPRVDGYAVGLNFFDTISYSGRASAGYGQLRTSHDPQPPVSVTDVGTSSGRLDLRQEAGIPFQLGAVKFIPYVVGEGTYYSNDLTGNSDGRAWGGGGLRASMPLTRLFPDAKSLLWNLDGLMHKIVLSGNYLVAGSTDPYTRYPQMDRLNDNATDQAIRDIRPVLPGLNPGNAFFLVNSPVFDPQRYAIRRLVDNRIDTLDDIQVVQLDVRQRLQTKRGFVGKEHIVDWMTLDLSASVFPAAKRDNFGTSVSFIEYDYVWNVGDRTALVSSGFFDPVDHGPRVFSAGAFLDRPDRTSFYLGYRQIDPLQSRAVTGAVTYVFSPKYAMTGSSTYDFGTNQSLSNTLIFTRLGSDLNVGFGVTYNALQNNFGVLFEVLPSLLAGRTRSRTSGLGGLQ